MYVWFKAGGEAGTGVQCPARLWLPSCMYVPANRPPLCAPPYVHQERFPSAMLPFGTGPLHPGFTWQRTSHMSGAAPGASAAALLSLRTPGWDLQVSGTKGQGRHCPALQVKEWWSAGFEHSPYLPRLSTCRPHPCSTDNTRNTHLPLGPHKVGMQSNRAITQDGYAPFTHSLSHALRP